MHIYIYDENDIYSQLEEQRRYYERQLAATSNECTEQRVLEQEKKSLKRQNDQLLKQTNALQEELHFVRELNQSLIQNQQQWKDRVRIAEEKVNTSHRESQRQIEELKSQIKDLMFYLDTQNKIEHSIHKKEIQAGSLILEQQHDHHQNQHAQDVMQQQPGTSKSRRKKK
jgi:BRCA1-associated protein